MINSIDDEQFFAWLDGELDAAAAERVAATVAASPELTARAEQHRQLKTGLRAAFEPVAAGAPAPPRFEPAEIIDFGARATARQRRRGWFSAPQWAAMAASLALGLIAGMQLNGGDGADSPVAVEGGQLVAAAGLREALDHRLASAPAGEGARIGLTFRNADGHICRSFTDAAASGLACREGDEWRIRGLFESGEGQGGDYRMAASGDPRLAALVDQAIAGEPFDAAQEQAAQERGWR